MTDTLPANAPTFVEPDAEMLDGLSDLYEAGRYLDAYHYAIAIAPLTRWRGARARVMAGRLASNLGGLRMGRVLRRLAFREHSDDVDAAYFQVGDIANTWGSLRALMFQREHAALMDGASEQRRAEWHALEAVLYASLRDWENADTALQRAMRGAPKSHWVQVEHSVVLELRDRYDEALETIDAVLDERPWYRPAVQERAHLLRLLGRDDEAFALLVEALERLQCYPLAEQRLEAELDRENYDAVRTLIPRMEQLGPCLDRFSERRLNNARMELALHDGRTADAIERARAVNLPWHRIVADNLEKSGDDRARKRLAVPFVRQLHMTCGPATLDALCRYWDVPARQPEIIDDIWFDGTTDYRERGWTLAAGLVTREFMLTWDAARALIDRDVPFALATVETTTAHLQAVIGYDAARRTLIIRDPTAPESSEFLLDQMLEHYASTGPRAMVFVPESESHQLDGIELPEVALYDELYRLRDALDAHDRTRAERVLNAMQSAAPGARLTLQAERIVAHYDGDEMRILKATEGLIARYPDDMRLVYSRQFSLGRLGRREEREACLADACAGAAPDVALISAYAELLLEDWRNRDRVEAMLRTLLRRSPYEAEHYLQLAGIHWRDESFDDALLLYRVAACLADLNTRYTRAFFDAARLRNRTDEALDFLRMRFKSFGRLGAQPAISLINALDAMERSREMNEVIEQALELRPDDPELHLELAELAMRTGRRDDAREHLARAEGRVQSTRWRYASAQLARIEGDAESALVHLRQILDESPMDMRAVRAVASTLADTEGAPATLAFLREWLERFPQSFELLTFYLEEVEREPVPVRLAAADNLLAHHPTDTWARRERALTLGDAGRFEEAMKEVAESIELAPMEASNYSVAGALALRQGDLATARRNYARTIELDADHGNALFELIGNSPDAASLAEAVSLIEREFERQVLSGDGLLAYQQAASTVLEPSELLASLERAHAARPDLWQAWVALGEQLIAAGRIEDAERTLRSAADRFSLLPRVWLALAGAHRQANASDREREALMKALAINPGYDRAVVALADLHEREGQLKDARAVVERALARDPVNARYHAYLADYLWKAEERTQALDHIRQAAELDPDYDWAWAQLVQWAAECGEPALPEATARARVERHPGEARSYLLLSRMLADAEERLQVLDQAIAREPGHLDAHHARIQVLCELERFDEVDAVSLLPVWQHRPPAEIRAWTAWAKRQHGDDDAALQALELLVESDPHFFDGWKLLAELHCDRGDTDAYLAVSQQLKSLRPRDPLALGYLGEAAEMADDLPLARESFEAATQLSPGYMFAQSHRFDLALGAEDYEVAEAALETFAQQGYPIAHAYREVLIAQARDDRQRALKALRNVVNGGDEDAWAIDESVNRVRQRFGGDEVQTILDERLREDAASANRMVGRHWGQGIGDAKQWQKQQDYLNELLDAGPAGIGACVSYLEALEHAGDPKQIDALVKRRGDELRADPEAWATVANTYRARGFADTACTWAEDWSQREDLGGWELGQIALACWDAKRSNQALAIHERALASSADFARSWHLAWYGLGSALFGEHANAARSLAELGDAELTTYGDAIRALAHAALAARDPNRNDTDAASAAFDAFRAARALYRPVLDDTMRWLAQSTRSVVLARGPRNTLARAVRWARMMI